jgi:preprotein translocase subunit SecG
MIFAAINWLSISINLLLVFFVCICLLMTLVILMQRPKQEGLGAAFGAGVTDQVFGARTTNVLQKATVWLGSLFFVISLLLAILIGQQNKRISLANPPAVVDKAEAAEGAETTPADGSPVEAPRSLLDELPAETPAIPVEIPAVPEVEPTTEPTAPAAEPAAPAEEPAAPAGQTEEPDAADEPVEDPSAPADEPPPSSAGGVDSPEKTAEP